jgi:hypothetical protein
MTKIRPDHIAVTLADCVRQDVDSTEVAAALAVTLRDVESTLSSVIGARGVAALYRRAVYLASAGHPWLSAALSDPGASAAHTTLQSVVSLQSREQAAAGAHAILHHFQSLLQTLVGASLTDRLLQAPLNNFSQRASAQDHRP